jgi:hypothetical protein
MAATNADAVLISVRCGEQGSGQNANVLTKPKPPCSCLCPLCGVTMAVVEKVTPQQIRLRDRFNPQSLERYSGRTGKSSRIMRSGWMEYRRHRQRGRRRRTVPDAQSAIGTWGQGDRPFERNCWDTFGTLCNRIERFWPVIFGRHSRRKRTTSVTFGILFFQLMKLPL